eukprot:TRINITY_DN19_c0_g1_i4.p1 TRINITY_DN19_c0_g1~~TRINITY_DN19_c0_g1_i4.p1  ORF type:complete len:143 (-),score=66.99 TRINITY_DN19_c0_g1_i4:60-488(-)
MFGGGAKCPGCGKTVYHAERQVRDGKDWHGLCLMQHVKEVKANQASPFESVVKRGAESEIITQPITNNASSNKYYEIGSSSPKPFQQRQPVQQQQQPVQQQQQPVQQQQQQPNSNVPKFCPECGFKLVGQPKFCSECGYKLK